MTGITVAAETLSRALVRMISQEAAIDQAEVRTDLLLAALGVDSFAMLAVAMQIEEEFGLTDLPPTLLWDHPTIDLLVPALIAIAAGSDTGDNGGVDHQ